MNKRDKALQLIKELEDNQDRPISPNLKENLDNLTQLTESCSNIVFRQFDFGNGLCGFIVYEETLKS
ncbi:hypothetical protein B4146_0817 [Bacillus subtilis]|uniref:Spore germination protein GerKA n=1 Tax=Bacillus subtilis TaxID=1423 RepID=A0A165A957_BACIU|nr:hypothetical protein B4146_0817 [Bacillus subtilis]KZD90892.1 Spore germination protein GerKA [Bacillus subtilis]MBO3795812.1 hypothetical protein [Bacillus subtilis]QWF75312.1 hypothetical protein KFF76_03985 [Bacillus subtilis]